MQDNNNTTANNNNNSVNNNNNSNRKTAPNIWLPPGFRFHPTDDELITFYLMKKVLNNKFCAHAIADVDLNKYEPWELPEKANMGEKEWYFFSLRDRKYPTGMRTNRATEAGYWKATGKDRDVRGSTLSGHLVGMKKTLVFYKGRAPRGEKTNWVMHEYRLEGKTAYLYGSRASKEEWVVCRIFQKRALAAKLKLGSSMNDDGHDSDVPSSPTTTVEPVMLSCKEEYDKPCVELDSVHDPCCNDQLSCSTTNYEQNKDWSSRSFGGVYNPGELARLLDPEYLPALNNHRGSSNNNNNNNNHLVFSKSAFLDNISFKSGLSKTLCKSEPHATPDSSVSYNKVMEASFSGLLGENFLFESVQQQHQLHQQQQQQLSIPTDQGLLNELLFSRFLSDPGSNASDLDQLYSA